MTSKEDVVTQSEAGWKAITKALKNLTRRSKFPGRNSIGKTFEYKSKALSLEQNCSISAT